MRAEDRAVPDAALRDEREMKVWDGADQGRSRREEIAEVFRFGHVAFKHPTASGVVQLSGPPPLVRVGADGTVGYRGGLPALVAAGAPREFGEAAEWVIAKAVERYDLYERLADDPSMEPREASEASGFAVPRIAGCETHKGRVDFLAKARAAVDGDAEALAFLGRHSARTAVVEVVADTHAGRMSVVVDGRDLPVTMWSERYPEAARAVCWGLRAAGVEAQRWANELAVELLGLTAGVGEAAPGAELVAVDFTRGLADWPEEMLAEDFEGLRDFWRDVQLAREDYVTDRKRREEERARQQREADEALERMKAAAMDELRMRGGRM